MKSKELLLVSCSAKKAKEAGKAKDVYKGTLYPDVFILAEKRGLTLTKHQDGSWTAVKNSCQS